ncbi:MAG TPA: hypothetical protein VGK90_09885 [Rhizomicrobium sp.]|jgi:hypothetical protein
MGATEAALRAAYFSAISWNDWATGAVTAGVVIELLALLMFGKEMPRNEKIALLIGSILVVVGVGGEWIFGGRASTAAAQLQQASDEKIAYAQASAANAELHAADLGITLNGLEKNVRSRTKAINDELTDLKAAEVRAKTALAKIEPLDAKESALSNAMRADEGRLSSQEGHLAAAEVEQAKNEKHLGELESETREYETENIDRGLVLDDEHAAAALKQFADVPVFISAHNDPETLQFSNRIRTMIRDGTGKEPKTIRWSSHIVVGVRVYFRQPFRSNATDAEVIAMAHTVDHQRAAATAICRELQHSKVDNVTAEIELADEAKPPAPLYWDNALPGNAVLILVGTPSRPLIEKKRREMNGMERLFALEEESDKANEELRKTLGRKGPCDPETL